MHEHEKKCIQVPVVLGVGSTQHLICTEIPLKPKAFEIKDTRKRVEITSCCVGGLVREHENHWVAKVIIDAVLKKNINFKSVGQGKPDDCNDQDMKVVCGDLRHCYVEIPFCTLVEVPIKDCRVDVHDLACTVKQADVVAECVEEIRDHDDGWIARIVEKDVVRISVKVERQEELLISASPCDP